MSPSQPVMALRDALGLTFTATRAILPAPAPRELPFMRSSLLGITVVTLLAGCTQETQNQFSRRIQNWTGTNGVLEVYAGDKVVRRFIHIDKLSTAYGTSDDNPRPYRFGYGVLDLNLNFAPDPDEKKVYFEISDYGTNYVFFESP
jgi:hypothetical protein